MSRLPFSFSAFKDAASARPKLKPAKRDANAFDLFLSEFYKDAGENKLLRPNINELVVWAETLWARRKGDESKSRVEMAPMPNDAAHMGIYLDTPDRAFIVASVIEAISAHGLNVKALFHPIVPLQKGPTSLMLIIVDYPSDTVKNDLKRTLIETMSDVLQVNADFSKMMSLLGKTRAGLSKNSGPHKPAVVEENLAFLDWLRDGHFVFLGARRYNYLKSRRPKGPSPDYVTPSLVRGVQCGVLRDSSKVVLRQSNEPSVIAENLEQYLKQAEPVSVAKSNLFSNVHRRVRMDYVSVSQYNEAGELIGETRFVGLFTSEAYSLSPEKIPLIRQKIASVKAKSKIAADSHNGKRLSYVLSTYPRDELFQIDTKDLQRIAIGVSQAFDRPRTRLFLRRDPFSRFISALVYIPREAYSTHARTQVGDYLAQAFNGRVSAFYPQYSDAPMARVHFIIGLDPDAALTPKLDKVERDIAALVTPWRDKLLGTVDGRDMLSIVSERDFDASFDAAYQARFSVEETHQILTDLSGLSDASPIAVRLGEIGDDAMAQMMIYHRGGKLAPSAIIPFLANFGIKVSQETAYDILASNGTSFWIHDFEVKLPDGVSVSKAARDAFETAVVATWLGTNEDDGFNALILPLAAEWRDIAFLRLIAAYRRQTGLDPSKGTQIEALRIYPEITRQLIALKTAKFALDFGEREARELAVDKINKSLKSGLGRVTRLDHDRVLRRMAAAIGAALRSNIYQLTDEGQPKPYMSVKFNSRDIEDLPAPKPYREIFVSSPLLDGVHLRFGAVARGGLRWSDRPEDFRAEVLGLVKAQQVKNSVIVPVGSKGGFFPKQLPQNPSGGGSRDDFIAAGIAAYKVFISGLLDITDNYEGDGITPPQNAICWDDPDPYLVVAADKGTATFSDIANGVAADYGFWLDDGFASGGSVGYDHKAMGITARGGWEAVKRHFRERGKDIQREPFTVIGVGDMSGDVFGNGMLLSKQIQLQAAFDHRDIFIDPEPDVKRSYRERARLFKKGRSSWQDYNQDLISKGGGIFSRAAKSISLTPAIKALSGLAADSVTPDELIHALLKAPCELLWFGGIGTYIKSSDETHADAMDKANDMIRINAVDAGAAVIGEGANLGLTQAGRIEFALKGGAINTDAIDNSAGVDSSDNEVNIKILLREAIAQGELKAKDRNALLAKMTDDVGLLVLQHNYDQTGALSLAQSRAALDHDGYERLMRRFESQDLLDRAVEGLPSTIEMQSRASAGQYLTRPEIAVLMAYVKNISFDEIITTPVADDPVLDSVLTAYFPPAARGFKKAQKGHRLRREIITSRLVNDMVDIGGPLFALRLSEQAQTTPETIAKAFIIAREALGVDALMKEIAALDSKVSAAAQTTLYQEIANVVLRVSVWLVRRGVKGPIASQLDRFMPLQNMIDMDWIGRLSIYDQKRANERVEAFKEQNIPNDLAIKVSLLRSRASGFDLTRLSEDCAVELNMAPTLFYQMGAVFWIDRIRNAIIDRSRGPLESLPGTVSGHASGQITGQAGHWDRLALRKLADDFYAIQRQFAVIYVKKHKNLKVDDLRVNELRRWSKQKFDGLGDYYTRFRAISGSGDWSVAKFSILYAQLQDMLK